MEQNWLKKLKDWKELLAEQNIKINITLKAILKNLPFLHFVYWSSLVDDHLL